jgi:hypothetical protein
VDDVDQLRVWTSDHTHATRTPHTHTPCRGGGTDAGFESCVLLDDDVLTICGVVQCRTHFSARLMARLLVGWLARVHKCLAGVALRATPPLIACPFASATSGPG